MSVTGSSVYVAADDIDAMLENMTDKDGVLIYKGPMHLDVSKPNGREQNGQFVITKPAKIWLTTTKFSRRGGQLRSKQTENLNSVVNRLFAAGKTLDLSAELPATPVDDAGTDGTGAKKTPQVVANKIV